MITMASNAASDAQRAAIAAEASALSAQTNLSETQFLRMFRAAGHQWSVGGIGAFSSLLKVGNESEMNRN
jgi:hypothetical protein